jgi:hypothetical protein
MVDAAGTTTNAYWAGGRLKIEDGPWASDTVSYGYNGVGLRSSFTNQQPTGNWIQTYGYDYIPGRGGNPFPPGQATCANVVAGVKKDHPEWKDPDSKGKCPAGLGKIAIFESADHNDFHFHRQDPDGRWSDKQGFVCEPAPILGPVFGPDKNPAYKFCQFLCIKNN